MSNLLKKLAIILLPIILLLPMFLKLPSDSRALKSVNDWGHLVIFCFATLVILLNYNSLKSIIKCSLPIYAASSTLLLLIFGISIEVIQLFTGRFFTIYDIVLDCAGICVGLLIFFAFKSRSTINRITLLVLATIIFLSFSYKPIKLSRAEWLRSQLKPVLWNFETTWQTYDIYGSHKAQISYLKNVAEWQQNKTTIAKVEYNPGTRYPGIGFGYINEDWSGYEKFCVDIFNPLNKELSMHFSIRDYFFPDHMIKFIGIYTIKPDENTVCISIKDIEQTSRDQLIDISEIAGIVMYLVSPKEEGYFYIDDLRLEGLR